MLVRARAAFVCFAFLLLLVQPLHAKEEGAKEGGAEKSESAKEGKEGEKGGEKDAKKDKKGEGDEDGSVTGGRFTGDPVYVHLKPVTIPVISARGAEQLVTLQIDLRVLDLETADNMHTNMPRVKDAILGALYGGLGHGTLRDGNVVDLDKVKEKILKAMDRPVGPGKVQEVLLQALMQRRL